MSSNVPYRTSQHGVQSPSRPVKLQSIPMDNMTSSRQTGSIPRSSSRFTDQLIFSPSDEKSGRSMGSDILRRIHAQSSADTSGLGDSLLRMHATSSTDTSGFGDPGGPSPTAHQSPYTSAENVKRSRKDLNNGHPGNGCDVDGGTQKGNLSKTNSVDSDCFHDCESASLHEQPETPMLSGWTDSGVAFESRGQARKFDGLKTISGRIGLFRDRMISRSDGEDDDEDLNTCRSPMMHRSHTDTAGRFLGRGAQSAWLQWSHDRRASYKRKIETFEKRQSELAQTRLSSPVRKARQESVRFASPQLETQHHLANVVDEAMFGHPAFPFDIPPPSRQTSVQPVKEEVKLTLGQWNALLAFWEHDLFVRCRWVGVLLGIAAVVLGCISIATNHWSYVNDHPIFQTCHSGLWLVCSFPPNNCSYVKFHGWHVSAIGLLIFSVLFDMMAVVLSICGVCTSALPKKIYYCHSSGESHFLCGIGSASAIIMYSLTSDFIDIRQMSPHTIGYSYLLASVACVCQCAAALFMCLDFLIHCIAKCLCPSPKAQNSDQSSNKSNKSFREGH